METLTMRARRVSQGLSTWANAWSVAGIAGLVCGAATDNQTTHQLAVGLLIAAFVAATPEAVVGLWTLARHKTTA